MDNPVDVSQARVDETQGAEIGTIGVMTGNWGGGWRNADWNDHVRRDLKGACETIVALQEARPGVAEHLRTLGEDGKRADPPDKPKERGGGPNWQIRPTSQWHCVTGQGDPGKTTLLIAAKCSLVESVRALLFRVRIDGQYKPAQNKKKKKEA